MLTLNPAPTPANVVVNPLVNLAIANVATCNLNQWVLDFKGNRERILRSINEAKKRGCTYRIGPELEVPGYSCEDHFYELDTLKFAWMSFEKIVKESPDGILCDVGMPVLHTGVRYNCRIFYLKTDGKAKILLIRPKMWLADDGNYRESRWFTAWSKEKMGQPLESYPISEFSADFRKEVLEENHGDIPVGIAILQMKDATLAAETCEELFTPESPNIMFGLEGVDIITNGSGSHWQMGKYNYRHELIRSATKRNGGVYMYSNLLGCEGNRVVFDGNGMIYMNGDLMNIGEHLSYKDVEVVSSRVNLDSVRTYRASIVSRSLQAAEKAFLLPRVDVSLYLTDRNTSVNYDMPMAVPTIPPPEEELAAGTARYLWDYLTRSGAGGFFLPLSGGVDSSSTAMIVYYMCDKIVNKLLNDITPILSSDPAITMKSLIESKLKTILKFHEGVTLKEASELVNIILHTCNMPTENNTPEIMRYATILAKNLGSYHMVAPINDAFLSMKDMVNRPDFEIMFDKGEALTNDRRINMPRYDVGDGDKQQHLAIQNIQARLRMLTAYYLAQIIPGHRYNQEVLKGDWKAYREVRDPIIEAEHDRMKAATPNKSIDKSKIPFASSDRFTSKEIHDKIIKNRGGAPFLLVLASSNSDESLRGFYTKYDASSADLNPIGSFSKTELRKFLNWCHEHYTGNEKNVSANTPTDIYDKPADDPTREVIVPAGTKVGFKIINEILNVTASPELAPAKETESRTENGGVIKKQEIQADEIDIGMTYADLYYFGLLRKRDILGPLATFQQMCKDKFRNGQKIDIIKTDADGKKTFEKDVVPTALQIAEKVLTFFGWYAFNRNKMTIVTPSIHGTNYSPDDNRYDQRPFLYPTATFWYSNGTQTGSDQAAQIIALAKAMDDSPAGGGRYSKTRNHRQKKSKTRRQRS